MGKTLLACWLHSKSIRHTTRPRLSLTACRNLCAACAWVNWMLQSCPELLVRMEKRGEANQNARCDFLELPAHGSAVRLAPAKNMAQQTAQRQRTAARRIRTGTVSI